MVSPPPLTITTTSSRFTEWWMAFIGSHQMPKILEPKGKTNHKVDSKWVTNNEIFFVCYFLGNGGFQSAYTIGIISVSSIPITALIPFLHTFMFRVTWLGYPPSHTPSRPPDQNNYNDHTAQSAWCGCEGPLPLQTTNTYFVGKYVCCY